MSATNLLTATPSTVTLSCSTVSGTPTPVNVMIKTVTPLTGVNTLAVTVGALSGGIVVTAPGSATLNAANTALAGTGIVYTIGLAPGCVGVTTAAPTFRFSQAGTPDVTVTVNTTLVATVSGLTVNPSPVTISCTKNGGVYTPGPAQTVSVTSAAVGGTPFTIDSSGSAAWLTVTGAGATAGASPTTFTVQAAAGCGALTIATNTTVNLVNGPGPIKILTVTIQIVPPTTLVATPNPATLTYIKGSGTAGKVDINITAPNVSPAPFFAVDTTTLPIWLTVDSTTGTAPKSLRFSSTSVGDTLAPGTYNASVRIRVSGTGDLTLPVTLLLTNKAPRLSVAEGTTRTISWTIGQSLPTPTITAVSTDTPISYTVTTGGTLAPVIPATQTSGLAYSFGTPISVSFNSVIFGAAQPGNVLTGTVTLDLGKPGVHHRGDV